MGASALALTGAEVAPALPPAGEWSLQEDCLLLEALARGVEGPSLEAEVRRPLGDCHRRWHALLVACAPGGASGWDGVEDDILRRAVEEKVPFGGMVGRLPSRTVDFVLYRAAMLCLPPSARLGAPPPIVARVVTCTLLREWLQTTATPHIVDVVVAMRQRCAGAEAVAVLQAVTELKAKVLDPPYTFPRVDSLAATPHTCLGNGVGNLATDSVPLATDSAPTLGCTAPDVSCPDSKDGTDDKVTPAVVAAAAMGARKRKRQAIFGPKRKKRARGKAVAAAPAKREVKAEVEGPKEGDAGLGRTEGDLMAASWMGHNNAENAPNQNQLGSQCMDGLMVLHVQEKMISRDADAFPCEQCDAAFRSDAALRQHRRVVHPLVRLRCGRCDATFKTNCGLQRHIQVTHEHPERRLRCQSCPQTFTTPTALRRHEREQHGSAVKAVCDVCSRAFLRPSEYFAHVARHFQLLTAATSSTKPL